MSQKDEYDFCKPFLKEDEYVVWTGKPGRGHLLSQSDIGAIVFGIVMLVIGLLCGWFFYVKLEAGLRTALWFGIFVVFGILLAIMPALSNASIRNKQRYVITNRRILIRKQMGVLAFAGEDLPQMKTREYRDGKITISFGRVAVDEKKFHTTIFDFLLEKVSDLAGSGKSESAMKKEWAECMLENLPDADRVKNAIYSIHGYALN